MTPGPEKVLSASRRTDIPACHLDWFMESMQRGCFDTTHPFTRQKRTIPVDPDTFCCIVFWSKNYDRFLTSRAGRTLEDMGYRLFFNFTVNSDSSLLEPRVLPLPRRLQQLGELADTFGPKAVSWRFDPICFYRVYPDGPVENNLSDFRKIASFAAREGIQECVTSFFDPYRKIQTRLTRFNRLNRTAMTFIPLPLEKKIEIIDGLAAILEQHRMTLSLCCEKEVFNTLAEPLRSRVRQNACIDGRKLGALFNITPDMKRDYGQRAEKGCMCTRSVDIGSYEQHPCGHNCLFCYANPVMDTAKDPARIKLN
mgnify:CR=1 FL=1